MVHSYTGILYNNDKEPATATRNSWINLVRKMVSERNQ